VESASGTRAPIHDFSIVTAMLSSGAFAQELIDPAPITTQRSIASTNGYIVVFVQGTSPNVRANVVLAFTFLLRFAHTGTKVDFGFALL